MSRDQPAWLVAKCKERDRLKRMRQSFPSEQSRLMALYGAGSNVKDAGRNEQNKGHTNKRNVRKAKTDNGF